MHTQFGFATCVLFDLEVFESSYRAQDMILIASYRNSLLDTSPSHDHHMTGSWGYYV